MTMTEAEMDKRVQALLDQEVARNEMRLWYLSFVGDGVFRGGVMVRALGAFHAIQEAWRLKINPGGECAFVEVDTATEARVDAKWLNRLLTKEQIIEFDAEMSC